jgi:hypothetical protein
VITTFTAFVALLLFVLPGFLLVQLQEAQRARRPPSGDLETVLRAVFYAIVIQAVVALVGWTGRIYEDVRATDAWTHHTAAIAVYVLVVVLAVPTLCGLLLGRLLKFLEHRGELSWWALAMGARDARHAWDRAFEQHLTRGALVVVHPKIPPSDTSALGDWLGQWRTLVGVFGQRSWASRTPAQDGHDLWLETVEPGDATGGLVGHFAPPRGLWIAREEISHIYIIDPTEEHDGEPTVPETIRGPS